MRFELQLNTSNEKQIKNYTILRGNDVIVTVSSLYLYIPGLVSSPEQQQSFNKTNKSSFTVSFGSWLIDRKPVNSIGYRLGVRSASKINVSLNLMAVHQKTQHDKPPRPPNHFNEAVFDIVDVKRYFVEFEGIRYPKEPIETKY